MVLPLHYTRTKTWHPARDSNSHQGFWRPVCCHYTSEIQLWWTVTGSNRSSRLAKPVCPQQHLQPIIFNTLLPMCVSKHSTWMNPLAIRPESASILRIFTTCVIATSFASSGTPSFAILKCCRLALPLH